MDGVRKAGAFRCSHRDRQVGQRVVAVTDAAVDHAIARAQAHDASLAHEVGRDRRRRHDTPLEHRRVLPLTDAIACRAERGRVAVEVDSSARVHLALLLANHQLAPVRGGLPVQSLHRVAGQVRPGDHVVGAVAGVLRSRMPGAVVLAFMALQARQFTMGADMEPGLIQLPSRMGRGRAEQQQQQQPAR